MDTQFQSKCLGEGRKDYINNLKVCQHKIIRNNKTVIKFKKTFALRFFISFYLHSLTIANLDSRFLMNCAGNLRLPTKKASTNDVNFCSFWISIFLQPYFMLHSCYRVLSWLIKKSFKLQCTFAIFTISVSFAELFELFEIRSRFLYVFIIYLIK